MESTYVDNGDCNDSAGSDTEVYENPFLQDGAEQGVEAEDSGLSTSESGSDEGATEESDSDDPVETEEQLVYNYARNNLTNYGYGCFLIRDTIENKLHCRECRRPWLRVPRIISHWHTYHYRLLEVLVDLHKSGLWDVDAESMGCYETMPNPYLVAAHSRLVGPTSNVTVQRVNHHAEVPTDDTDDRDIDMAHETGNNTPTESDARNYCTPTRHDQYSTTLLTEGDIPPELSIKRSLLEDPWCPFTSGDEFNLASWFLEAGVNKCHMNSYFNRGLGRKQITGTEFTSSHKLRKRLGEMMISLSGEDSLHQWRSGTVSFFEGAAEHPVLYHYRQLEPVIQSFFEEPCFQDKLVFLPEHIIRSDGRRQITEMHTADWWWRMQVCFLSKYLR